MPKDLATIKFNGEMDLSDFSKAMSCFEELMAAISGECDGGKVRWQVEELQIGSLTASVRADADDDTAVVHAIGMYEDIGRYAAEGMEAPFPSKVRNAARKMCGLINGRITSIDFSTENVFYEAISPIDGVPIAPARKRTTEAFGAVRGRVQTISDRHDTHFTLYDVNDDHAIDCYANENMKPSMREAWGNMCVVSGFVRRHATGKISSIRAISKILVLQTTTKESWRDAIGCAPAIPGSISIEEAVRRVRDDE